MKIPDYPPWSIRNRYDLVFIAFLYLLSLIAFGFTPYLWMWDVISDLIAHPDVVWQAIRFGAGCGLVTPFVLWGFKWIWKTSQPPTEVTTYTPARVVTEAEVLPPLQRFQETSAYGDADYARRQQVAQALTGKPDGLSPRFED